MRKETQEVRGLRRALAEAYLSERAARKKELVAVRAKEAALREMQATLAKRLDGLESKTKELDKGMKEFDDWRGTWEEDDTLGAWAGCIENDISGLKKHSSHMERSVVEIEGNIKDIQTITSRLRSKIGW